MSMNHGQKVYISDIPHAVEEVDGVIPRGPTLDRISMLKDAEVYITDIPPALWL